MRERQNCEGSWLIVSTSLAKGPTWCSTTAKTNTYTTQWQAIRAELFCFFDYLAISARRRAFIYSCRRFQSFLVSHRHRLCEDVARNTVLHVDISAHPSPHGHRFLLTLVGALNFKFLSKPEISSISLSLRSKLVTSKFCCRRFAELDLGITLRPRCVDQRSRTCAGVLPCASEIFLMTGWSNRRGVSAAIFMSHSMKL